MIAWRNWGPRPGILWWLYAARVLTEVIGLVLMRRIGHSGRLLQDVIGALVFLAAIVAAAGYVLELPVKRLLATSGVVAIVVGLALQSTLSDVFSGIVLNTTKPYQVDDWISIDGVEGKVLDIDWRATHLLTSAGSTAVVPNSVAAKAKIVNLSRPSNMHGVSISIKCRTTFVRVECSTRWTARSRQQQPALEPGAQSGFERGRRNPVRVRGQRFHRRARQKKRSAQSVVRPGPSAPGSGRYFPAARWGDRAIDAGARLARRGEDFPFAERRRTRSIGAVHDRATVRSGPGGAGTGRSARQPVRDRHWRRQCFGA
jgi:hypothetical protein